MDSSGHSVRKWRTSSRCRGHSPDTEMNAERERDRPIIIHWHSFTHAHYATVNEEYTLNMTFLKLLTHLLSRFQRRWWHLACWAGGLRLRGACVSSGCQVKLTVTAALVWWKAARPLRTWYDFTLLSSTTPESVPSLPLSRFASVGPCEEKTMICVCIYGTFLRAVIHQLICIWIFVVSEWMNVITVLDNLLNLVINCVQRL